VSPLELPDPLRVVKPELLSQYDSVAFFIHRAQAVRSGFHITSENATAIAEICVRLDGLPLAIELAAARSRILPPEALLRRLTRGLDLLTGGARDLPSRQQTLDATIEWSYRLLTVEEQRLFTRLAVFAGGCTFEAAETVCDPDGELGIDVFEGVCSLVEKTLLRQEEGSQAEPRVSMLETIREYALVRLESSGEGEELRRRHADHFLDLAEQAAEELRGASESQWLERLEAEHNNLRAALAWSSAANATELQLRIAGALWLYWFGRGYLSEGRGWLEQALEASGNELPRARANALMATASLMLAQGDFDPMKALAEESLALLEELGDPLGMERSLTLLGHAALHEGKPSSARPRYEQSVALARRLDDKWSLARALNNLGDLAAFYQDDLDRGVEVWQEALALCRQLGNADMTGSVLSNLGFAALTRQQQDEAERLFRESLELFWSLGGKIGIGYNLEGLAAVAVSGREAERAARLLGAADASREEIGVRLDPYEERVHEQSVASVRKELAETVFATVHQEGRAMSLEQAVAYALGGR